MKITSTTDFHWRNYLKPTPPLVFWLITVMEAVILTVNGTEILTKGKPGVILTLLILQTIIGKAVGFFGKIKEEYEKEFEKKVTVTMESETPITVTTEETEKTE